MSIIAPLNFEQKKATAILLAGTFLEYFDLMLYLHMAVFLNELFFPKISPHLSNLIAATGFCSVFVFRPIGALFFGYIGDIYGRKSTVIMTTTMMSICCIAMAFMPTYQQIGITAAWLVTICRIVQGLSSMGEVIGAQIYLSELIKKPDCYPIVNFIGCSCVVGSFAALAMSNAVLGFGFEWRIAFLIGALIAIVGSVARTALRETPEFANAQLKLKKIFKQANLEADDILKSDPIVNEKVNQKTSLAYFFLQCGRPVCFYFLYVYCACILKNSFNYSPQQIIQHNLIVSFAEFIVMLFNTYLCYKICPLKIIKVRVYVFCIFIIFLPYLLANTSTIFQLYCIQFVVAIFQPTSSPAEAILFTNFPVFKRFRYISFLYAISRALVFIITSFGFVYLTKIFDYFGLLIIFIPLMIVFIPSVNHFARLERSSKSKFHFSQTEVFQAV